MNKLATQATEIPTPRKKVVAEATSSERGTASEATGKWETTRPEAPRKAKTPAIKAADTAKGTAKDTTMVDRNLSKAVKAARHDGELR